jgi:hypothetical protein
MPNVGELTIHLMLGKTWGEKCMRCCGMLCVMHVLNKFEPKEATNLVSPPKCVKRMLDEFPNVIPKELPNELRPRKQVEHAIKVMLGMASLTKALYRMNLEELKELKVELEKLLTKGYIKPSKSPYGHPSFLFTRRMGH